jgi:hypothetical protein
VLTLALGGWERGEDGDGDGGGKVYCMVNLIVSNLHEGTACQKTEDQQV